MTLVIMAAGMATRFGSLKQIEQFGPSGETIIDYSIYDAITVGFNKVVVVVRESTHEHFAKDFSQKYGAKIKMEFVDQELYKVPNNFAFNPERQKPWGTGHALLVAKNMIDEPFCVINGDDFYGRQAYQTVVDHQHKAGKNCAMVGYKLAGTLSEYGTVSRGVCSINNNGCLTNITERTVKKKAETIVYTENDNDFILANDTIASMNFWMLQPEHLDKLEQSFSNFLSEKGLELKSEFYLPGFISSLIAEGNNCEVLTADSNWFGVTYKDDVAGVKQQLKTLVENNIYPTPLW